MKAEKPGRSWKFTCTWKGYPPDVTTIQNRKSLYGPGLEKMMKDAIAKAIAADPQANLSPLDHDEKPEPLPNPNPTARPPIVDDDRDSSIVLISL